MKYRIDDWVLYKPFADSESDLLKEISDKAVILYVFPKNDFYDYEIYIDETGKRKKVREHQLFPVTSSTY
jgi:hypothetical protein